MKVSEQLSPEILCRLASVLSQDYTVEDLSCNKIDSQMYLLPDLHRRLPIY